MLPPPSPPTLALCLLVLGITIHANPMEHGRMPDACPLSGSGTVGSLVQRLFVNCFRPSGNVVEQVRPILPNPAAVAVHPPVQQCAEIRHRKPTVMTPVESVNAKLFHCHEGDIEYYLKQSLHERLVPQLSREFAHHEAAYKQCKQYVARPYDFVNSGHTAGFKIQNGNGGPLYLLLDVMERHPGLGIDAYRKMFYRMAQAVECLARHNMAHLDIKLDNFVLVMPPEYQLETHLVQIIRGLAEQEIVNGVRRNKVRILLIDFDTAVNTMENKRISRHTGTSIYQAPEISIPPGIAAAQALGADVFSLGALFYYAADGRQFPHGNSPNRVTGHLSRQHLLKPIAKLKFDSGPFPLDLYRLIAKMTARQPGRRPDMAQVLKDPFFHSGILVV